jgi:intracellular multiplication protein IcmD
VKKVMKPYTGKALLKSVLMLLASMLCLTTGLAVAATLGGNGSGLGEVATNITNTFGPIAQLITAGAYIAGFGFAVAAILKFKAHKDNPQQVPVGTPIALLFIAVALIFLPSLFKVGGDTLFGTTGGTAGTVTGTTTVPGQHGGG